ncbi:MAG: SH3 domain-containing protein [Lachnospiraceae bacterium]|nr:SH3 domain-containing protein [Lachnospiraceae bacterium]
MSEKLIDVSSYQGDINWNHVKSCGVDYAILKVIRKDLNPDTKFEQNWTGCQSANVTVSGVYNYSYATTVAKAKTDAQKVLTVLNGRKCTVWLDVEDKVQQGIGPLLKDIINAYMDVIVSAGYDFGVYTGMSFYNSYLKPYASQIKCNKFWIARYYNGYNTMALSTQPNEKYNPKTSIGRDIYGWQYTSSGVVSGISGNVDINIIYDNNKEPSNEMLGKVSTQSSNLNIRKEPNTTSAIVGSYKKGEIVKLISKTSTGWYRTDKGYVSGNYITIL